MKTAQYIKNMIGWSGDARLYKLSEPMLEDNGTPRSFVIVSATITYDQGEETYIFPAENAYTNEAVNWAEMPGSCRGTLDHTEVLNDLGYTVLP